MSPRRLAARSFDAALQSPGKIAAGFRKYRNGRNVVVFDNAADAARPLIVRPPDGLSAHHYRLVLIATAETDSLDALKNAHVKFRTQLRKAFAKDDHARPDDRQSIARALAHTLLAFQKD